MTPDAGTDPLAEALDHRVDRNGHCSCGEWLMQDDPSAPWCKVSPETIRGHVAEAVLASDWLAAHDAQVRADERRRALTEVADRWQQGGWSDVLLPRPTPPAVPVIAYANRVTDWLRGMAEEAGQ